MSEETQVPAGEEQVPALTFQDLALSANIIDLAVQRGAFKAAEAQTVGAVFNKLAAVVKALSPESVESGQEEAATEETQEDA